MTTVDPHRGDQFPPVTPAPADETFGAGNIYDELGDGALQGGYAPDGAAAEPGTPWYKRPIVLIPAAVAAVALAFSLRGDGGEQAQTTPTTAGAPAGANGEGTVTSLTPTSLSRSEQLKRYAEAQKAYLNFEGFAVAPVRAEDPATYLDGLNRLFAVAVMDNDSAKSQQAVQALTGTSATPAAFRQFIATTRQDNLTGYGKTTGSRNTLFSDPNDLTVVASGPGFAIVRTTNALLNVRNDKVQLPQEVSNSKSIAYYYVRVLPDGTKQLMAVDNRLNDWHGGEF